jgi:hypothetical protein
LSPRVIKDRSSAPIAAWTFMPGQVPSPAKRRGQARVIFGDLVVQGSMSTARGRRRADSVVELHHVLAVESGRSPEARALERASEILVNELRHVAHGLASPECEGAAAVRRTAAPLCRRARCRGARTARGRSRRGPVRWLPTPPGQDRQAGRVPGRFRARPPDRQRSRPCCRCRTWEAPARRDRGFPLPPTQQPRLSASSGRRGSRPARAGGHATPPSDPGMRGR